MALILATSRCTRIVATIDDDSASTRWLLRDLIAIVEHTKKHFGCQTRTCLRSAQRARRAKVREGRSPPSCHHDVGRAGTPHRNVDVFAVNKMIYTTPHTSGTVGLCAPVRAQPYPCIVNFITVYILARNFFSTVVCLSFYSAGVL